jgi:hypothetical protein
MTRTVKLLSIGAIAAIASGALCFRDRDAIAQGAAACNNQPNMMAAIGHLRNARASLDRAEHDKGGWRVSAIRSTDNAIRETERGCAFADTH